MSNLYNRHLISMSALTTTDINNILHRAKQLKQQQQPNLLADKIIACCFFEPSTRTRLSFEAAALKLNAKILGLGDINATSFAKGESLEDSIKMISTYADLLLIRHPQAGMAQLAADYSAVPIVNCGDGANEHPTQTLLDLFSIQETQGKLTDLNVVFAGDLKYSRTVNSLIKALSNYNTKFSFVASEHLQLPEENIFLLTNNNIDYQLTDDIAEVIDTADIIYMTREQKERFTDTQHNININSQVALNLDILQHAKDNLKILHPLPRLTELPTAIDDTPYAYYFQQAQNGVFVRQAILSLILQNEHN